ncbi:hypothetical protein ACFL0G_00125 [Candidatus Zixiibacteriota bacterium]
MSSARRFICLMTSLGLALILLNCAALSPSKTQVSSMLTPIPAELGEGYAVEEDGTVVYEHSGCKVTVQALADESLNAMFPEESGRGEASTNPYTYGNWVDPDRGYTPTRFTVFKVTVHNYTLPKINLNPSTALLVSDRGDRFNAYVRESKEIGVLSFEDYYRERMGSSGRENSRFQERMGIIRQTMYVDGKAFKGDMKEGFLVFDPLDPKVKKAQLVIENFVLRFDANDWPSEVVDLTFQFDRQIESKTEE